MGHFNDKVGKKSLVCLNSFIKRAMWDLDSLVLINHGALDFLLNSEERIGQVCRSPILITEPVVLRIFMRGDNSG